MNSWIFQFISDDPVAAFFIAWPVMFLLVGGAAIGALIISYVLNFVLHAATLFVNTIVILIRGYTPTVSDPNEPSVTNSND